MMGQGKQDEKLGAGVSMGYSSIIGLMPDFPHSFRGLLEQVRMDKRRAMDQMIEMVQTEMALERILEG